MKDAISIGNTVRFSQKSATPSVADLTKQAVQSIAQVASGKNTENKTESLKKAAENLVAKKEEAKK